MPDESLSGNTQNAVKLQIKTKQFIQANEGR